MMEVWEPFWKRLGAAGLVVFVCLHLPACASVPADNAPNSDGLERIGPASQLWVTRHQWHTSLTLSAELVFERIPELQRFFPKAKWIEFGWGDEDFYRAEELSTAKAIAALFWPTSTVMHVVGLRMDPDKAFPYSPILALCLSQESLEPILNSIRRSFKAGNGSLKSLGPGIYGDSMFFPGSGSYHALYTCNTWTARVLEHAGIETAFLPVLFASQVMSAAEPYAMVHAASCDTENDFAPPGP